MLLDLQLILLLAQSRLPLVALLLCHFSLSDEIVDFRDLIVDRFFHFYPGRAVCQHSSEEHAGFVFCTCPRVDVTPLWKSSSLNEPVALATDHSLRKRQCTWHHAWFMQM